MHKKFYSNSISHLPNADQISFIEPVRYKITLPVYCLSLFKSPTWKPNAPGILYVTDFTSNEETAFYRSVLPQNVSINFQIEKPIDSNKILSIGVPSHLMEKVSNELSRTNTSMKDYNFNSPDNCQFESEGIFARVVFILKLYRGCIEGSLVTLVTLDRDNIPVFYSEDKKLDELVSRYMEYSSPEICDSIVPHFPIGNLGSLGDYKRRFEPEIETPSSKLSNEPPSKVQKVPNGVSLAFHQHKSFDDTQKPITTSTQPYGSDDVPSSLCNNTQASQNLDFKTNSFDDFLVNKVTVDQLLKIPLNLADIKKGTTFEVDAYIKGILPFDRFVVKPFKRTLKVTPFKLILSDNLPNSALSATNTLVLEFNTEEEICHFLSMSEVEEMYDSIKEIEWAMDKLLSTTSNIRGLRIKRSLSTVDKGFLRPYWTCSNNLNDLIHQG
ncbi:DEHA2F11814p [Debaryomyces hansenii CBS767]|jgi:hypothetical protein|uniref:DEHA2F11814p n=1 Tax=Debaryomyces hansenii (strain ATCC 36239 / CBS 767 / BCRC 21394 / JCM 1990 / NBRC 0083 / IGC 2968) TaxID=284592 RepID=Q6BLP4_DEBHA|nr:DEHA2F11814p [Debaryomyces hansenii CBS767]CAG89227.1 DEHA2F11814p [Debaryomyces hansenii CBS767]|eukprot:XP_460877.1 DEHA2F11814p [Debaryomyces hansenii CBS767]